MDHSRGGRTRGRPDDLRAHFVTLPDSVPLADIPSLPPPKVVSPIQEYPMQQMTGQYYNRNQSLTSVSSPTGSAPMSHTSSNYQPQRSSNDYYQNQQQQQYAHHPQHQQQQQYPPPNMQQQKYSNQQHQQIQQQHNTQRYQEHQNRNPVQNSGQQYSQQSHQHQHQNQHQNHHQQQQQQRPVYNHSNHSSSSWGTGDNVQNVHSQRPHADRIPSSGSIGSKNSNFPHQHQYQQGYVASPVSSGFDLAQQKQVERKASNPYFQQNYPQQSNPDQYNSAQPITQKQPHLSLRHQQHDNLQYSQKPISQNSQPIKQRTPASLPTLDTHVQMIANQHELVDSPASIQTTPISASIPPIPRAMNEYTSNHQNNDYRTQQDLLPGKAFGIKQRTASENFHQSSYSQQQPNDPQRSPSLPVARETLMKLTGAKSATVMNVSTDPNTSPSRNGSIRTSPIVRQSISFLSKARNFSVSSNNGQPESPVYAGHSTYKEMEKYHAPLKQVTGSGRVIPQKINYNGQNTVKKSRSFNSLSKRVASSSSLRGASEKNRFVSTTSLASSALTSSPSMKKRYIYPALLSEVADAFLHEVKLSCHFKYGIEYRNSFSGSEAVDVICNITKIRDRNLAIILGRALDFQKLFHDVSYEHRLRDNKSEVYMLSDELSYDEQSQSFRRQDSIVSLGNQDYESQSNNGSPTMSNDKPIIKTSINSVFTLLTECYSPTCTRDKLCYSVSCPRRFEQKMRSEMQSNGTLVRSDSHISFDHEDQKQYWQLTVPKEVVDGLDKNEVKRQECIFETINSEKTFIKDLEYIREFWMRPLSETKIIKDKERDQFLRNVFHNINEIWEVNHRFAEALVRRQQKSPIVESIADIFLEFIPQFTPFITYGAGQVIGKYEFDRQRRHNALLRRFIEDTAKREESKRLDLSSFLSKPTTRPARYPLLLRSIKDHTDPESPDYEKLNDGIELLQKMLTKINFETGKQSDKMNLFQIKQKLLFKPGELVDLKLSADNRKVIYQCTLKKKGYQDKEKQGEIYVYLFDHCILFVKLGYLNKREVYKVYQRPIPLPLLFISPSEMPPTFRAIRKAASKNGSALSTVGQSNSSSLVPLNSTVSKSPISFKYLGVHGYELTLYGTPAAQKILATKIEAQTKKILADNDVYTLTPLCSNFFDSQNRINCVVPFDGGRKFLYGTDSGIYISDRSDGNMPRSKVISKVNIIQAEIIQEYQILIALCDKKLICWPTSVLTGGDSTKNAKLGKELMNHVSFFKIGICDGRMLLCAAKSTSNIVRIFEPIDPVQQKKKKNMFTNNKEDIHFSSEPVSINFLKTKLCVGCSNGFQIVSLFSNSMEELLDPADTSLEFATNREGLKPLGIDRINSDFLLSYSNYSFFINHNGWRVRPKWMIEWEGVPHQFALWYPYLLAFETNFIEIRSVQNSELLRVIVGENIRFLHASSQEILYAYVDDRGYDVVASLDFWDKSMKNRSRGNTINDEEKVQPVDI